MSSNSEPSSDQQNNQDDNAPLWRYVTREAKLGKGGGNVAFQCNFCRQIYKGSYYRVKAHLLKIKGAVVASCTKVTNENLVEMRRVVEEAEQRVKLSNIKQVPLPTSSAGTSEARIQQFVGVSVCRTRGYADTHRIRVGYVSNTPCGVSLTI